MAAWSGYWVNDRLLPRRPWVYQPLSRKIDTVLAESLGEDLLKNITLDDPTDRDNDYGERLSYLEGKIEDLEERFRWGIQIFLGICSFFLVCLIFVFIGFFRNYQEKGYI